MHRKLSSLLILPLLSLSLTSFARDEFRIELKNNSFTPQTLLIPANKKIKLIITNKDNEPEEFDSFDLNREKVLFPNRPASIYIGPLNEGEYHYFGEFHPDTAKGKIIVVEMGEQDVN